ncbi:hypothetical protein CAC42_7283 [Sphaceloma murrayae]|uniref:SET domain-containing protein n=1 Tax=Sphaceloma murrayae TaxID=2082308 RepID=A0A2K1QWP7_9PEZI|nr:hypothetical protein CAC42_7283 [Sphaceloma murrayae]
MTNTKKESHLLTRSPHIGLVLNTPKGRGIFATAPLAAGTIIETCPVLVLDPTENTDYIEKTELFHYTYNWPLQPQSSSSKESGHDTTNGNVHVPKVTQAVVLGLGSMFNHSTQSQNVGWTRDIDRQIITYHALRDIPAGEELCISYGSRLTFTDADAPPPEDEGDGTQVLSSIELS